MMSTRGCALGLRIALGRSLPEFLGFRAMTLFQRTRRPGKTPARLLVPLSERTCSTQVTTSNLHPILVHRSISPIRNIILSEALSLLSAMTSSTSKDQEGGGVAPQNKGSWSSFLKVIQQTTPSSSCLVMGPHQRPC